MGRRWRSWCTRWPSVNPSQDLEQSLEGYLWDFEQLALKYSLPRVQAALAELRIKPGQQFFPRPDEVASEIERQRESRMLVLGYVDAQNHLRKLEKWRQEHLEYRREMGWDLVNADLTAEQH